MSSSQPHKRVTLGGIEYSINEEDKTARVTNCKSISTEIIIPRSIKHESKEYIVTIIANGAFKNSTVRSVSFEPNSELRIIENDAFAFSALTSIQIPAGLVELKDGWCGATSHLIQVEVDPGNARYSNVGGKLVIGKSDITNEDYDTLVFCARDSIEANIPATIKIIGVDAFSYSALASIRIPSHVTQICEGAFLWCEQLSRVEFASNSELRTIGEDAFIHTKLASIQIPSHVTQICEGAFYGCNQLERVEFASNSELRTIGEDAFSYSALASIEIPSHVTQICEGAFYGCIQLERVEFASNSELRTIGKDAFFHSALAGIQIPSHVTQICDGAFLCEQLQIVEIDEKSLKESIGVFAFIRSKIVMLPARGKPF